MQILPSFDDRSWVARRGPIRLQIALATFAILALELALIRWMSGQIRVFAYFNNLILIGAFLGMGLGVAVGRRRPGLVHGALPMLAALGAVLAFAEPLGLVHMPFPDSAVHLWGAEARGGGALIGRLLALATFLSLFVALVAVFVFAGGAVGHLFGQIPTLRAYGADLVGSLAGIVAFTLITVAGAPPPVWMAVGGAPLLWLSRSAASAVSFIAVVAFGWVSINGATYSPYNRIDLAAEGPSVRLSVNRDFHQYMHNLSDEALKPDSGLPPQQRSQLALFRNAYDIPFSLSPHRDSALVVAAGTGNDVAAALRADFDEVYSVDIDGRIIDIGRKLHPERPYDDERVVPVTNDARAFFEQYDGEPFDVVCFGLLDSHAMFTQLSTLRLDSYVYTEEGIRAAWEHVAPGGVLAVSFSLFGGPWIGDRLYWTIAEATGKEPRVVAHNMHYGHTFIVAREGTELAWETVSKFGHTFSPSESHKVRTTRDDWPFLYLRPGAFPWGYILVLGFVLVSAAVATRWAFGREMLGVRFDGALFLMGAAFLLIETRGVTTLALLFGSTWVVNSAVFAGVLVMVLLANVFVQRTRPRRIGPWFVLLFLSIGLVWAMDVSALNALPLTVRGIAGGMLHALPIGFAGVIVSMLLAKSAHPAASLGSNLLGAVLGGCLEYLSMWTGLRALVVLAFLLYLAAFLLTRRRA